ncbi:MAG: hypothetical protein WC554_14115 [Clostridia bacterium]
MSNIYPDSIKLEMQFAGTAGAWTDVTDDVIRATPITCTYGIQDSSPLARVASTGTFNFSLDNSELNSAGLVGYYSPGHTNCRSGFAAGITVRFSVIYGGISYPKFYGRIPATGIQIIPGANKERKTLVEVRDFIEQCAIHEIDSPAFVQSKTAAELIQLILAEQSIQPLATDYKTCEDTFFSAFEDQSLKLNCLSAINDACLSEFGYAYIRHDTNNFEKFVVEGRKTRTGITSATTISVSTPIELCGYLLKEDGGKFQLEDGSGYIKLDEASVFSASFDNEQYDAVIQNGNDLYNSVITNSIPKEYGTAILYFNSGYFPFETYNVGGTNRMGTISYEYEYRDIFGAASPFLGIDVINPVATVDFKLYNNTSGTGFFSQYTSPVTSVSTNYGNKIVGSLIYADPSQHTDVTFYVFGFQVRGTALKSYSEVTSEYVGTVSQFGKSSLTIDMPYQIGTVIPSSIAGTLLTQYQNPVTRTENITFHANSSIQNMMSFLVLDIGDRFTYQEIVSGINEDYFINGVNFEIYGNNIITFGYKTKQASLEVF